MYVDIVANTGRDLTPLFWEAGNDTKQFRFSLTHSHSDIPHECIVCYSHTFENNFGRKGKFTKYLKESCCLACDQHFSFKCFQKKCLHE